MREYSLRLDQTIRAIKELRTKHTESKLYILGHSEGAGVANLIKEPVDGVITTFKGNSNWRWRQFKHLGHVLPITDPAVLSEVKLFVGLK